MEGLNGNGRKLLGICRDTSMLCGNTLILILCIIENR